MGSFRSKEDDVAKISTSIFVLNFPDSVSANDLFHSCKQYGHVVESFIPMKRLKDGKRFGFVRFINVFNNSSISTTSTPSTVFFKVRRPGVKSGTDISLLYAAQSVVERRQTSTPWNGVARELLDLGVVFVGGIGAHWTPR
ncbi:nucleotide-binding alpha-beta plait domain-containing protein [Tanacetum coccineum]